jgi:5-methylthioadenosine/S-adenosylhomocysteine deaminase
MVSNRILIRNGTLITSVNGVVRVVKNVSILIENDLISEVSTDLLSDVGVDRVIDATGKIIMPSLVNTHTHNSMCLFRGLADDMLLDEWLNDCIWPLEAGLNGEFVYYGALLSSVEMIRSGTTTFNDQYFFMPSVADAVLESGIRGCLCGGMIDFDDEVKRKSEVNDALDLIDYCKGKDRLNAFLGPHSPITVSEELLLETRRLADKYNTKIHIHVSETSNEVDDILAAYNMRPFEYLEDIGFLGPDVIAAHCIWLDDNEIDIIQAHDVKVSHNPVSNMKIASGISPVGKLLDKGVCLSVGTDGAASNNNLDMFEEVKIASLLQKVDTMNPKVFNVSEAFKAITINGARALGLDSIIGSIEVGKKADIILVDTLCPNMTPNINFLLSHLIYSASGSNVDTTICNGEILMDNKHLNVLDEENIINNVNSITQKLKC